MLLGLAHNAVCNCFRGVRSEGCDGPVDWRPLGGVRLVAWDLPRLGHTGFGGLSSKVEEFQQLRVVWHTLRVLAELLPFKGCAGVQLRFQQRSDE